MPRPAGLGPLVWILLALAGPVSAAEPATTDLPTTERLALCLGSIYGETQISNGMAHEFRENEVAPMLELIIAGAARLMPAMSKDAAHKGIEQAFRMGHRSAAETPLSNREKNRCLQNYMKLAEPILKEQQAKLQQEWAPNLRLYRTWLDDYAWSLEIAEFYGDDAAEKRYGVSQVLGYREDTLVQEVSLGVAAWSAAPDVNELRERLCPSLERARQYCQISEAQAALHVEFSSNIDGASIDGPGTYCILPDRKGPYHVTKEDRPVFCSDLR